MKLVLVSTLPHLVWTSKLLHTHFNKTQKKSSEIKLILCLKLMLHMGAWGKNGLEAKILKKTQAVKISPYSKHKDAFVS